MNTSTTLTLVALLALSPTALALHGGTYRGPGTGIGPGGAGPGTGGPGSGGAGSTSWEAWWSYNRDPYLRLKDAVQAGAVVTVGEDFYLGLGQAVQGPAAGRPREEDLRSGLVPALIEALEGEDDPDLVTAALMALAKVGLDPEPDELPRVATVISGYLQSSSLEVQEAAALALGVLGQERGAPLLADLMADTEGARRRVARRRVPDRTRALAAYGLGLIGYRSPREDVRRFVVQRLTGTLAAPDSSGPDLETACVLSLGLVRLPAGAPPEPAEDDAPGPSLPSRSREAQVAWLLDWLREGSAPDHVRAHAPVALARLCLGAADEARESVQAELLRLLRPATDAGRDLQRAATIALGLLGDCDADEADVAIRSALVRLASDRDAFVRSFARISLARVASRPGSGEEPWLGAQDAVGWLLRDLARGRATMRPWTAIALGLMEHRRRVDGREPDEGVRAALRARLIDPSGPGETGALCIALGLAADLDAAPLVHEHLRTGPDSLRSYAAISLGLMGDREAIPDLREAVREASARPGLLREAATALGLLGDRELVPELVAALAAAGTLGEQSALAVALGTIGDARAVAPLLSILRDEEASAKVRAFAAVALGIVADKERLPFNSKLAVDVYYGLPASTLSDPLGARGVLDIL